MTTRNRPTLRLLTVGNSFSQNAVRFLPGLAEAAGYRLIKDHADLGGCSLERHWSHVVAHEEDPAAEAGKPYGGQSLKELLLKDRWDVVTLQQYSWISHDIRTYRPYARLLKHYIRRHAPQAEILMHQTWAYRCDDPRFHGQAGPGMPTTPDAMYRQLKAAYERVAGQLRLPLLPVGDAFSAADTDPEWAFRRDRAVDPAAHTRALPNQAHSLHCGWFRARNKEGKIELHYDGHHANNAGMYLGGCVWFERLFRKDVTRNRFVPPQLDASYADFLRRTAHHTVRHAQGG